MRSTFTLPMRTQPDLAATMDIQIPALAWQPLPTGRFARTYCLDGHPVRVEAREADRALVFTHNAPSGTLARRVGTAVRAAFPIQVGDLELGAHPALEAMRRRYRGVVVMHTDPFEALVLTMLSQNRTGETVRAVFPALAAQTGGAGPAGLTALDPAELRAIIRPAGPYKAPRLAATAARVLAEAKTPSTPRSPPAPARRPWPTWNPSPAWRTRPPPACWCSPPPR